MKIPHLLRLNPRRIIASLCGVLLTAATSSQAQLQPTGPQQLVFTGLLASTNPGQYNAQFNAVQSDSNGNLYLLLNQNDGIRLLKTDPTATTVLGQLKLGSAGDTGLAMVFDPAGNLYVTGTSTSGSLPTTSGAAFPSAADTSTNSFIGKFDQNFNLIFLSYTGGSHIAVSSLAATPDAVFLTGSIFTSTLPVTPSGIIQSPASGSLQNGFVERFSATGSLVYATYLSGLNGNTAPAAITADTQDNAYIAGYTTSSGYPTFAALVPNILSPTSGFLTKLTPAGDGLIFSTFIPGPGISSIALDPATQTLLLSGAIAPGQFPIATVPAPLVSTTYQTLLRLPLDGSSVLSSTLLAPGTQSTLNPAANSTTWVASSLTTPASLLPVTPLSTIGNSYALRITDQSTTTPVIDQAIRFGGLPSTNPNFASLPATITSLTTNAAGQPTFAGNIAPTASASLLSTETYDLPLYASPTSALPSTLRSAILPPSECTDSSLCSSSAAYLARLNPTTAAPSLAISADSAPNLILRNLGTVTAKNLTLTAPAYTVATDCPTSLPPGAECNIALSGTGSATLTAQADNALPKTVTLTTATTALNPIDFTPKELDFGVETSTSPQATRTITVTNLSQQTQSFTSTLGTNQLTPYSFAESSSDCSTTGLITTKTLGPNASCHITVSFSASAVPTDDGFAQSTWTIGAGSVQLTAYSQAVSLNLSASEIDFGTQYPGGIKLPRYLYISNNSSEPVTHTPVTLQSPFTLTDHCPSTLEPHTVCQLQITYNSPQVPSADSTTLTLDDGLTTLITGTTLPPPTATGQSVNPNLIVNPAAITFSDPVPVSGTSSLTQTATIGNIGTQPFPLTLGITGDFTFTTDCPVQLPGNATCSATLTFTPTQSGIRQGILSVTAGTDSSPIYLPLSGTGSGIITATNATVAFGNVPVGEPAVQWYKINTSFTALTAATTASDFKAILIEDTGYGHGQPPSSAFANTYTNSCRNCWLGVQFTPSSAGAQTTILALTSTGAPSPLTLTGTGLPNTGLILTPTTQGFGSVPVHSSSAPTLFTLTNLTTVAITLTSPTITGDFAVSTIPTGGPTCSGTLAPNATCFVNILFAPTATGQHSGTLAISTLTAPLTGFGSPDPGISLNPSALIFNNVPGPTATQQIVTLTNTGNATIQIAAPTTATPNFESSTTCTTLAPNATCIITVNYLPTSALVTDTLQIPITTPTLGLTTYIIPLTGAYTTETAGLQILPMQSEYGATPTSTVGATRQFTINNLTAKSLELNLGLPRQFVLAGPPCAALAPNASCTFSVSILPLTNGDITGTLFAQGTPSDGSATLNGIAYVEGYGTGAATLSITGNFIPGQTVLDFGQLASGQSSSQTVTLTNTGNIALTIRRLTSQWPFLITSTTCGTTLTPAEACTVTLTFTPLNQSPAGSSPLAITDTGSLIIESDALSSPDIIDLTGTIAPPTASTPSNTAPLVSFALTQSSLTFTTTQVGNASAPQTITLSNTGATTIHINSVQVPPDFSLQSNCGTVTPTSSCNLIVTFTPQPGASTSTTRLGAIEINSDASTALEFVSLVGNTIPSPLVLSPISLDFGSVQLGSSAQLPIQVTNTSSTPAFFTGIATSGDYTATGTCPTPGNTLAPSTSCTITVTFTPSQTGIRTGTVGISTSLSTLPINATLTGIGTQSHLQLTPTSLNFGSIAVGASSSLTFTLTNTGTASLRALALSVTGDYAITVPCNLTTIAPGASCTVTVTFTPTAIGPRNSNLSITSSASTTPTLLPLNGAGVPNGTFTLTVDGGPSATATVQSERPATYNLQLTPQNSYSGTIILNCTPITPGQYATCSLLPSNIDLTGSPQTAVATINTITTVVPGTAKNINSINTTLLCLLPSSLLFFWRTRRRNSQSQILYSLLIAIGTLGIASCGGTNVTNIGDPSIRVTPPGTYQYQVTASSATGVQLAQSVTLNLIVTAKSTTATPASRTANLL
jgi:trimeric autotransporter adhesin